MKINNEADLQVYINKDLKKLGIKFIHLERGRRAKNNHVKGIPDLMIFPGEGKVFFVELKWGNGKLRKEQIEFLEWCKDWGYKFYIARSIDEWELIKKIESITT
jgi:hypothetical protein